MCGSNGFEVSGKQASNSWCAGSETLRNVEGVMELTTSILVSTTSIATSTITCIVLLIIRFLLPFFV